MIGQIILVSSRHPNSIYASTHGPKVEVDYTFSYCDPNCRTFHTLLGWITPSSFFVSCFLACWLPLQYRQRYDVGSCLLFIGNDLWVVQCIHHKNPCNYHSCDNANNNCVVFYFSVIFYKVWITIGTNIHFIEQSNIISLHLGEIMLKWNFTNWLVARQKKNYIEPNIRYTKQQCFLEADLVHGELHKISSKNCINYLLNRKTKARSCPWQILSITLQFVIFCNHMMKCFNHAAAVKNLNRSFCFQTKFDHTINMELLFFQFYLRRLEDLITVITQISKFFNLFIKDWRIILTKIKYSSIFQLLKGVKRISSQNRTSTTKFYGDQLCLYQEWIFLWQTCVRWQKRMNK